MSGHARCRHDQSYLSYRDAVAVEPLAGRRSLKTYIRA